MLLKFFSQINGIVEPGGLDYILKNPTARLLRGNVEITRAVIDSCPPNLTQRFSAGVLNDLSELGADKDELLLDELELRLLAGRPKESMPWCVVEHLKKGKREKHFVIPIYDLFFEKNLHPYLDRIDQKGFEAWVEHFNLRHGVLPPSHRLRTKPPFEHLNLAAPDIEFLRLVWECVETWVIKKEVGNRQELEERLIKEGYRVRCHSLAGKPLKQPVIFGPQDARLRLTGSIYYRLDFGMATVRPLVLTNEKAVKARLAQLREIMSDHLDFRAHHLIGRIYGKRKQDRVTLGRARQHFEDLIQKKMMEARRAELPAQRVDYHHLEQVISLLDSGLEPVILPRKRNNAGTIPVPCPHKEAQVKAIELEAGKTTASVVVPVVESVESSDFGADHSEDISATVLEHSNPAGEHVEQPSITIKSEAETPLAKGTEKLVSVVNPIVAAVNSSDSKTRRPDTCSAGEMEKPKAVGGLKQELTTTQKSDVKTLETGMITSPSAATTIQASVESTDSTSDRTNPHSLPSDDQTQTARKTGKKRPNPKKSVHRGKTPISKEVDGTPQL